MSKKGMLLASRKRTRTHPESRKRGRSGSVNKEQKSKGVSGLEGVDEKLLFVFLNPLRIRLLAALNEGEAAPVELARRFGCSTYNADYHVKVLVKMDYAELVRTELVGSVTKHYYRATRKVEFPQEVFDRLPPSLKRMVLATVFMTSYGDTEVGLLSGSFIARPESHASWTRINTDERAWTRVVKLLDNTMVKAIKIAEEGEARLEAAEGDDNGLLVSLNMSAFTLPRDHDELIDRGTNNLHHQPEEAKGSVS